MEKRLVLIRHGNSEWNKKGLFTGWKDVDLSRQGISEAHQAGALLRTKNFQFGKAYTSYLKRAIRTLWIILDELDMMWLPVERDWRLNERHYGALQGLNKEEMTEKKGKETVHAWRRQYDVRPPLLEDDDPRIPDNELKYSHLQSADLPRGESLKDTRQRVEKCWINAIAPAIEAANAQDTLIVAHGNSIRALIMLLENLTAAEIEKRELATGVPEIYTLNDQLKIVNYEKLEV